MSLKRFNDYISEKDQHRQRSERDEVLDKEIEDVHSDEQEIPSEEEINNSDISVEDLTKLSEVNEGAVKEIHTQLEEILGNLVSKYNDIWREKDIKEAIEEIMEVFSSNENLTEKEDVDGDIVDKAEEELHKETEEDLKDGTKKVFNTTSEVENELEVNKDTTEDDFVINPSNADFKLMKDYLGENTNYTELRSFLKETFPGWEKHTGNILDTWGLIK